MLYLMNMLYVLGAQGETEQALRHKFALKVFYVLFGETTNTTSFIY